MKAKLIFSELVHKSNYSKLNNNDLDSQILNSLKRDGFYVYENFLTDLECTIIRNEAESFLKDNPDKVKAESNGYDLRVYGIDKYTDKFNLDKLFKFSYNLFSKFSWAIKPAHFLLFGKIIAGKDNLGSGSGWHRDSCFMHQFKTILYLSDVNENNGPFQYIKGSHLYKSVINTAAKLSKSLSNSRFTNEEIESIVDSNTVEVPTTFCGKAGTLLIVDTRGLHRGMPLKEETRYALTNYHFVNGINQKFFKTK